MAINQGGLYTFDGQSDTPDLCCLLSNSKQIWMYQNGHNPGGGCIHLMGKVIHPTCVVCCPTQKQIWM